MIGFNGLPPLGQAHKVRTPVFLRQGQNKGRGRDIFKVFINGFPDPGAVGLSARGQA
jgi:hypothetical protein